jgi:hypothetical protein
VTTLQKGKFTWRSSHRGGICRKPSAETNSSRWIPLGITSDVPFNPNGLLKSKLGRKDRKRAKVLPLIATVLPISSRLNTENK